MLHEAESWQKKASILVQGIINLIAQQDKNTSIGIARDSKTLAEESKRDSTSMTTIAVVTMTFLPGTFAAVWFPIPTQMLIVFEHFADAFWSLFSLSMFQWNATSGKDVVNNRFWIYWIVTVPLTLATFVVWIIRTRYRNNDKTNTRLKTTNPPFGTPCTSVGEES
jgi:hypothetical protein